MEEPKAPEPTPQLSNPPTTVSQTLPPQPSPCPSSAPLPPTTRKRPLESDALLRNSNYVKSRSVIRDLRPHFIEVLRTPDYQNCKASHEIREQLKILMKLYDNLRADVVSLGKAKNLQDGQNLDNKTQQEQPSQHFKSPEQLQVEKEFVARSSENKFTSSVSGFQKLQTEDGLNPLGTYIVGGSAFGWNFITYSGNPPVYYGRTKKQFRSVNVTE